VLQVNHRISAELIARDHSFLRNGNFKPSLGICKFPWNFYVFAEFCRIRQWPMKRGEILHILVGSGGQWKLITDASLPLLALTGGILKILIWAYMKYY